MNKKYIIAHWTAGNYEPNLTDLTSYQMLINGIGKPIKGKEKTSSTGGMNSITYNISICGRKNDNTPIKKIQFESLCNCMALMCVELGLTEKECFTHYEIGKMVQDGSIKKLLTYNKLLEQNIGKIDFKFLDFDKSITNVGEYMRNKIKWYITKIKK